MAVISSGCKVLISIFATSYISSSLKIDIISLEFEKEKQPILEPQKIDFDIIFEDEYFIVINKPAGLVVHPGNGNLSNTLANGLLYYLKDTSALDQFRPGIVHRLDKETSGVIVTAKNEIALRSLSALFQNREVQKEYEAIVWGAPIDKGYIKNYIQRDLRNKT